MSEEWFKKLQQIGRVGIPTTGLRGSISLDSFRWKYVFNFIKELVKVKENICKTCLLLYNNKCPLYTEWGKPGYITLCTAYMKTENNIANRLTKLEAFTWNQSDDKWETIKEIETKITALDSHVKDLKVKYGKTYQTIYNGKNKSRIEVLEGRTTALETYKQELRAFDSFESIKNRITDGFNHGVVIRTEHLHRIIKLEKILGKFMDIFTKPLDDAYLWNGAFKKTKKLLRELKS